MRRRILGGLPLAALSFVLLAVLPADRLAARDQPAPVKGTVGGAGTKGGAAKPAGKPDAKPDEGSGGLDFAGQKSDTPLEIYADQGLELSQDAKTIIGRVNATAIRGHVTVKGDVLVAHYRDKTPAPGAPPPPPKAPGDDGSSGGSNEVWRVEADGHVSIATPTEQAFGDHADYNIDDAVVVLTGKDLKLITQTDTVTARDSLEYWERKNQAVARGNAVAVRGEKRIQADILVADFARNAARQMAMQRAHGYNHVIITSPHEVVTGDRADYNAETGIVTVTGSVKITRDDNQLDGGYAVVNLNTGISRIFPSAPGGGDVGDRRVKGLFMPQKKPGAGDAQGAGPAAGASQ